MDVRISLLPCRPVPLAKNAWSMMLVFLVGAQLKSPEIHTCTRGELNKEYPCAQYVKKIWTLVFIAGFVINSCKTNNIYIHIMIRISKPSTRFYQMYVFLSLFLYFHIRRGKHGSAILKVINGCLPDWSWFKMSFYLDSLSYNNRSHNLLHIWIWIYVVYLIVSKG